MGCFNILLVERKNFKGIKIMFGYYTHVPLLRYLIENKLSEGSKILELGCGDGSSSLLSKYSKEKNIYVESYESDKDWFIKTKNKYENPNYIFNFIEKWNDLYSVVFKNKSINFDAVFVDQSGVTEAKNIESKIEKNKVIWEPRLISMDFFKDSSRFIVVHDYNYYPTHWLSQHERVKKLFKYWKLYEVLDPPTLLCSNLEQVEFTDIDWKD